METCMRYQRTPPSHPSDPRPPKEYVYVFIPDGYFAREALFSITSDRQYTLVNDPLFIKEARALAKDDAYVGYVGDTVVRFSSIVRLLPTFNERLTFTEHHALLHGLKEAILAAQAAQSLQQAVRASEATVAYNLEKILTSDKK